MQELIPVKQRTFQGEQIPATDARQLHAYLESKRDFSNWMKHKVIDSPFFTEGQDYILLNIDVEQTGSGGHNRIDYAITLDTAKELSMMEHTVRGKEARLYFIKWEKIGKGGLVPVVEDVEIRAFKMELVGLDHVSKMMKFSENSLLVGIHEVYSGNGVPTRALPQFTEKVRVPCPAKDLLEKNNCGMSSIAFNKLLVNIGYLEPKTRLGSKGETRPYKSITEKGLKYGQNDAYRGHPTHTQPHWFEDTFMELFALATAQ